MEKHAQNQKIIMNNKIFKNNQHLQRWLEENWLIGSLCIKLIVEKQIDQMNNLGIDLQSHVQNASESSDGHPPYYQPQLTINSESTDKEGSKSYIDILLELTRIQE